MLDGGLSAVLEIALHYYLANILLDLKLSALRAKSIDTVG
jgi:hypothetical protein